MKKSNSFNVLMFYGLSLLTLKCVVCVFHVPLLPNLPELGGVYFRQSLDGLCLK